MVADRLIRPVAPFGSRSSSRFSATVIQGSSVSSWNTVQAPRSCAACGPESETALPVDADDAGIRPHPTAEDFDECRFAGTVLADEGMDLAGGGGEGRGRKRRDTAVGFADLDRFDSRSTSHSGFRQVDVELPVRAGAAADRGGRADVDREVGPPAVKSSKKLSGWSVKTLTPSFRSALLRNTLGTSMFFFG